VIGQVLSADKIWDRCIVGTGPVGMAMAMEFERIGREVPVIESGGVGIRPELAEASRAEIANPASHAAMELAVCRALGGTSWTCGGRCVPYDAIDWAHREFVADAHWPLSPIRFVHCTRVRRSASSVETTLLQSTYYRELKNGLTLDHVERWSRESKVILEHRDRLFHSERIRLRLNSTVTSLNLSADGSESRAHPCPLSGRLHG
jgi:2-polyprenyl-6-methoxyphenol hydroxylase-like FAD-dependent oxidoreductase